jgi:hypothetical protein
MNDVNPRGLRRPRDGTGGGIGRNGGLRQGRNREPCNDGPGYGRGGGQGKGRRR